MVKQWMHIFLPSPILRTECAENPLSREEILCIHLVRLKPLSMDRSTDSRLSSGLCECIQRRQMQRNHLPSTFLTSEACRHHNNITRHDNAISIINLFKHSPVTMRLNTRLLACATLLSAIFLIADPVEGEGFRPRAIQARGGSIPQRRANCQSSGSVVDENRVRWHDPLPGSLLTTAVDNRKRLQPKPAE